MNRWSSRSALLLLVLGLPSTALARKKAEPDPEAGPAGLVAGATHDSADGDDGDEDIDRPRIPAGSSLWDYIEAVDGEVPTPETVEATEELSAERAAEEDFLVEGPTDPTIQAMLVRTQGGLVIDPKDDPYHLASIDPAEFDIPIVVNASVVKWIDYFTGRGRKYYKLWLSRSTRVRPMMYARLDAAHAPRDLVYLSMIESGYNTHAYSTAAAVGLWQFISSTGRLYKLRVDSWVDERRDPYMATDAAIHFLTDLEKRFGHWYLAFAGYNGGPGRVNKGVKAYGTSDFWELVDKNAFADETDNYVPKLIAAAIIGKHPERYGFTDITYEAPLDLERVVINDSVSLDVLARCAGLSVEQLQHYNPHIRRFATPAEPVTMYMPKGKGDSFVAALAKVPADQRIPWREHTVKRGETLSVIASRYGVSARDLQDANKIRDPNKIYVGMNLVVPMAGADSSPTPRTSLASTTGASSSPAPKAKASTHTVQKGETLSTIAAHYGVSLTDLKRWNSISNANLVKVGQTLKVYTKASSWSSYTVRSGDTLSGIAAKQGCSMDQLKSWNGLSSTKIYAGQQLKVRK